MKRILIAAGVVLAVVGLVILAETNYDPSSHCSKPGVCAVVTYTCDDDNLRVSMEVEVINDTDVEQEVVSNEVVKNESGGQGTSPPVTHSYPPHTSRFADRDVVPGETDTLTYTLPDGTFIAKFILQPAELCQPGDIRN